MRRRPAAGMTIGVLVALAWMAGVRADAQARPVPNSTHSTIPAFPPALGAGAAIDPENDGWSSEVMSALAEGQLQRLADWVAGHEVSGAGDLLAPDIRCRQLGPPKLDKRFDEGGLAVHRAPGTWSPSAAEAGSRGADCFSGAVNALTERLAGLNDRHAKFKLFRIELEAESFTTRAYFEASASGPASTRQINSVWMSRWTLPARDRSTDAGESKPLLLDVEVSDYEEVEARLAGGRLFEDVTVSAIGHNPSYRDQLLQTPEHWLSRLTKATGYTKNGWQGISIADVNGDGLDDVFLPEQGGLPNRLFVQNPDGTFDDRSVQSSVDFLERTLAGLFVDLDNDGDRDLVLSSRPAVLVLENDGRGRFSIRRATGAVPDSHSLSAADYDLDGDLDLYICAYQRSPQDREIASPIPYHDANNGGRNMLLRNDGGFQFTDVTVETGLDRNNRRFSLAASWEDFDNDGDPDLYVANDYGRNNLYRNDGVDASGRVRFVDVAAALGVEDISSGMSVSWGDYNRDGSMDLYVGNMFSAAGNRITYQRRFERDRERAGPLAEVQRMARGNSLFENVTRSTSGQTGFVDRSEAAGVNMGRWAWSSVFADLDNDGWEDIVVANGNLTQTNPDDL